MTEKTAAIVTLRDASKMTPKGRKAIAAWIKKQAGYLERGELSRVARTYQARYLYR